MSAPVSRPKKCRWAPTHLFDTTLSTFGSKTVLAVTSADRQLIPRFRTNRCSAEAIGASMPSSCPQLGAHRKLRPIHPKAECGQRLSK
jgi:hypothetical protein